MTVDWVVLTAVMTGFGVAIAIGISDAATARTDTVEARLVEMPVAQLE